MFSTACGIVRNFVRPVAVSVRLGNGKINSGLATFIVVNRDGWIVTSAHVLNAAQASQSHAQAKAAYDQKVAEIKADQSLTVKQRNRKLEGFKPHPEWIVNQSLWWGQDGVGAGVFRIDPHADVAIAKLTNLDTSQITTFPTFKDGQSDPPLGTSLCRMGFPFSETGATFEEAIGNFRLNLPLLPPFPNDGIHTRIVILPPAAVNNRIVKFIETSTPGLKGQSGGPLFNARGEVWGIQSSTDSLELGFSPKPKDGKTIEHQFMNVGRATHIQHVIDLFRMDNVQFQSAP